MFFHWTRERVTLEFWKMASSLRARATWRGDLSGFLLWGCETPFTNPKTNRVTSAAPEGHIVPTGWTTWLFLCLCGSTFSGNRASQQADRHESHPPLFITSCQFAVVAWYLDGLHFPPFWLYIWIFLITYLICEYRMFRYITMHYTPGAAKLQKVLCLHQCSYYKYNCFSYTGM